MGDINKSLGTLCKQKENIHNVTAVIVLFVLIVRDDFDRNGQPSQNNMKKSILMCFLF